MKNRMRSFFVLIVFLSLTFLGCKTTKQAGVKQYLLNITNPSAIERADELVVLTRATIEEKMGPLSKEKFVAVSAENRPVPVQFDDVNADGIWDEAVFLFKFKPNERVLFTLTETTTLASGGDARAHVRMRRKNENNSFGPLLNKVTVPGNTAPTDFSKQQLPLYLTEGPAWENDKVAFRLYMDTRNTKDIYGKTTHKMMMDTVGADTINSYHDLSDWGMDILAVGKSLGAGSLALLIPKAGGKDTLVRLGGAHVGGVTYEKIADGPLRGIFRMTYGNWSVLEGMSPITVTEEISIWGGKYFYESKVSVSDAPAGTKLVTGVVNLKSKKAHELSLTDCKVLYTYDNQSENKDKLGMSVIVRNNQFAGFGKTPNAGSDVLNTYTVTLPISAAPSEFRFYSGWELSDLLFTKEESFKIFLASEAVKYSQPLVLLWN